MKDVQILYNILLREFLKTPQNIAKRISKTPK